MRSGFSISETAVPSARNSGLERTWKVAFPVELAEMIVWIAVAVFTGMVDFSTMILLPSETSAIKRAADSM